MGSYDDDDAWSRNAQAAWDLVYNNNIKEEW